MKETDDSPELHAEDAPSRVRRWVQCVSETILLLGLVVGMELMVGDGKVGAFRTYPHPYWLVVLPMAAGRGLLGGMIAAGLASILYVFGAKQALGIDHFAGLLSLDVMLEPVLFHSVCFLVGEMRDVVGDRLRNLQKNLVDAREQGLRMRQQRDVLTEANRILERRIVDQHSHFGTLIDLVARTENASKREILDVALELVEEQCGASASVWIPHIDGRVEPYGHRGWAESEAEARLEETRQSEFIRRAMLEGKEINGFSLFEQPPESGPLVVTPLLGASGVIEAFLCLEDVPTTILNASTVRTFQAIGNWASAVMTRLEKKETTPIARERQSWAEPSQHWLGTTGDFVRRLFVEYERTARYGLPLSFIAIRVTGREGEDPPPVSEVDEFVVERFATRVRCSDAVYRFPHPGCYLLVMPGTPLEGAEAARRRLVTDESREWPSPGEIHVHCASPGPDAPDPESLVRTLVEAFRATGEMLHSGELPMEIDYEPYLGTLDDFRRALFGELGLAMRNEYPLQVVSVRAEKAEGVEPGLLAAAVLKRAPDLLRRVDTFYSVGVNHCAAVLPMSDPMAGEIVAARLIEALVPKQGSAPWGELALDVLPFGPEYPYFGAFMTALASERPLAHVAAAGDER